MHLHALKSCTFAKVLVLLIACLALHGCSPEAPKATPATVQYSSAPKSSSVPLYRLAVHPLHNPDKLSEAYQPLVDYLNSQLRGIKIELESSRDYQAYEKKFRQRLPAFLLPNPWQTLQAQKVGYHVIAMAGDAQDFKGIFVVRKDSGITKPTDLKGKSVSYPSYTALAAAIMPQVYLHDHGINIRRDIQNVYVGSQESSMMNVVLKQTAAGATWPPPWRLFQKDHPQEAEQLRVVWETPSLINNSVMVRDDVAPALAKQVADLLLALPDAAQGQTILQGMQTAQFHPASDASYEVVADYVARFERDIRPVESPQ